MTIKDYSLISNQWIEDKIKKLSIIPFIDYEEKKFLQELQQQLKPAEPIVSDAFDTGVDSRFNYENGDSNSCELDKEEYLNKEL